MGPSQIMAEVVQFIGLDPAHRDVITTGGQIVIATVVALGGVLVAQIQYGNRDTRRVLKRVTGSSSDTATLDTILTRVDEVACDLRGLRKDHRDLSRRADHISQRLDHHIEGNRP